MSKDIYRYFNNTSSDIPQSEPLSDREVEHYMDNFRNTLHSGKRRKSPMTFITKSIAAALAVAVIGGTFLFGMNKTEQPSENWFYVSLSAAAETSDTPKSFFENSNDTNFNVFGSSEGAMTGFFMDNGGTVITKDGYVDYFSYYHMENFNITGANIQSIKLESNKKGIYFTLIPNIEDIPEDLEDTAKIDNALSEFKERNTLNNSQYTFDEIRRQVLFILWPCDSFVYDVGTASTGDESYLLTSHCFDIILESDHSDPEIAELVNDIGAVEEPNQKEGYERYTLIEEKIQQKMLENAQLTVTVVYDDNSTSSQTINLVYGGNRLITFECADNQ